MFSFLALFCSCCCLYRMICCFLKSSGKAGLSQQHKALVFKPGLFVLSITTTIRKQTTHTAASVNSIQFLQQNQQQHSLINIIIISNQSSNNQNCGPLNW